MSLLAASSRDKPVFYAEIFSGLGEIAIRRDKSDIMGRRSSQMKRVYRAERGGHVPYVLLRKSISTGLKRNNLEPGLRHMPLELYQDTLTCGFVDRT